MTLDEFNNLKIGDTVYYYKTIDVTRLSTLNATTIKKEISVVFVDDDTGKKRIGLKNGGVILNSFLNRFDLNKDKLLYNKIKEIKSKLNKADKSPFKYPYPIKLKIKYEKILNQKNVQGMLKKYPEFLI